MANFSPYPSPDPRPKKKNPKADAFLKPAPKPMRRRPTTTNATSSGWSTTRPTNVPAGYAVLQGMSYPPKYKLVKKNGVGGRYDKGYTGTYKPSGKNTGSSTGPKRKPTNTRQAPSNKVMSKKFVGQRPAGRRKTMGR